MKLISARTALTAAALLSLATATVACGSDDNASDATSAPTATTTSADTTTVKTSKTDLGTILVDADGRTLYMFAPDKQGPSTCDGQCITNWPALTGPATAGEGVEQSLLGTAARSDDGTEQVTYGGWPLYHFGGDAAPGDVNGQGTNDVWYVIDASGAPIGMSATTPTTPTTAKPSTGYGY